MARTISSCARRTASTRCSRSRTTACTAPTGCGSAAQGSVINTKFNAPDGPICTDLREAGALLARQRGLQAQLSASAGAPRPRSSSAARRNGSSPMDQPLQRLAVARAAPSSAGSNEGGAPIQRARPHADAPRAGARSDRRHPLRPRKGPQPHRRDGRGAARLGDQPPARLGRADRAVRRPQDRRAIWSIRRSTRASSTPSRREGVDAWIAETARQLPRRRLQPRRLRDGHRHPRRLVRQRLAPTPSCSRAATGPTSAGRADLYLEGSDQHRGWFQSSLLESCGTRGRAPYDAVLTHGFTMDAKGMKMSKSLGNTVDPLDVMRDYGADILRLWALSVDFTEDHRIGKEILAGRRRPVSQAAQHLPLPARRARRVQRAKNGWRRRRRCPSWSATCSRCSAELDATLRRRSTDFDFNTYVRALTDFCNEDLSRLLLRYPQGRRSIASRRDRVRPTSAAPTAPCSTPCSTRWSAGSRRCWCSPARKCGARAIPDGGSVHLLEWPEVPDGRRADDASGRPARAARRRSPRRSSRCAARRSLGSSLEAEVTVPQLTGLTPDGARRAVHRLDSRRGRCGNVVETDNHKCGRCWRYLPEVRTTASSATAARRS